MDFKFYGLTSPLPLTGACEQQVSGLIAGSRHLVDEFTLNGLSVVISVLSVCVQSSKDPPTRRSVVIVLLSSICGTPWINRGMKQDIYLESLALA